MTVNVCVLAGGRSSRMGTNKALLPIDGSTVIERICDELKKLTPEQLVIVAQSSDPYQEMGYPLLFDQFPGKGPLAGIHAAMSAMMNKGAAGLCAGNGLVLEADSNRSEQSEPICQNNDDLLLVAACDMPFVTAHAGEFLLACAQGYEACVPLIGGRKHPLFAVYRLSTFNKLEHALQKGHYRVEDWIHQLHVRYVGEHEFPGHIPVESVFFNMNEPKDWEHAVQNLPRPFPFNLYLK